MSETNDKPHSAADKRAATGSAVEEVSPSEVEELAAILLKDAAHPASAEAARVEAKRRIVEARARVALLRAQALAATKRETPPAIADPEYILYEFVVDAADPTESFHRQGGVTSVAALRGMALFERWDADRQDAIGYGSRAYYLRNAALGHERQAAEHEQSESERGRLQREEAAAVAAKAKELRLTEARRVKALLDELNAADSGAKA